FEAEKPFVGQQQLSKAGAEAEFAILAAADWIAFGEQVKFFVPFQIAAFVVFFLDETPCAAWISTDFASASHQMRVRVARFHVHSTELERLGDEVKTLMARKWFEYEIMQLQIAQSAVSRQRERY